MTNYAVKYNPEINSDTAMFIAEKVSPSMVSANDSESAIYCLSAVMECFEGQSDDIRKEYAQDIKFLEKLSEDGTSYIEF